MIIEGNVSVKAALLSGRRKIQEIYVDEAKHQKDTAWILHRAQERHVPIHRVSREKIDGMAFGRTHGGLLAVVSERIFQIEEECMDGNKTFIAVVEGVEDPFNLGYIMRTLYSAGCTGLVLRARNWGQSEQTILKSSAGACDYMNVVMAEDVAKSVAYFKKKGVFTYAAMRADAIPYTEGNYERPVLIAIGGEMRGLSSSIRNEIDQNIYIPYANDFRMALNAAGATAVLGFEVLRQRGFKTI